MVSEVGDTRKSLKWKTNKTLCERLASNQTASELLHHCLLMAIEPQKLDKLKIAVINQQSSFRQDKRARKECEDVNT